MSFVLKRKQDYFKLVTDLRSELMALNVKADGIKSDMAEQFNKQSVWVSKLELELKALREKAEALTLAVDSDRKKNDADFLSVRKDHLDLREKETVLRKDVSILQNGYKELSEASKKLSFDLSTLNSEFKKSTSEAKAFASTLRTDLDALKGVVAENKSGSDSNFSLVRSDAKALTATVTSLQGKMGMSLS